MQLGCEAHDPGHARTRHTEPAAAAHRWATQTRLDHACGRHANPHSTRIRPQTARGALHLAAPHAQACVAARGAPAAAAAAPAAAAPLGCLARCVLKRQLLLQSVRQREAAAVRGLACWAAAAGLAGGLARPAPWRRWRRWPSGGAAAARRAAPLVPRCRMLGKQPQAAVAGPGRWTVRPAPRPRGWPAPPCRRGARSLLGMMHCNWSSRQPTRSYAGVVGAGAGAGCWSGSTGSCDRMCSAWRACSSGPRPPRLHCPPK